MVLRFWGLNCNEMNFADFGDAYKLQSIVVYELIKYKLSACRDNQKNTILIGGMQRRLTIMYAVDPLLLMTFFIWSNLI